MPQTCISLLNPHKRCFCYPSNSLSSSLLLTLLTPFPIFSTPSLHTLLPPPIFPNLFSNSPTPNSPKIPFSFFDLDSLAFSPLPTSCFMILTLCFGSFCDKVSSFQQYLSHKALICIVS
ncbi:hypothetical protein RIF29_21894 [Crotalaria pallida]|uniref:Uncharacterized protein n=1 Tax=Crotalaria pallida TaxID=3830 RepID=A0AAN9F3F2_CROPI